MVILLSFGTKNYKSMIISDIIAKISAVLYSYWVCRDFIKGDFKLSKTNLSEVIVNISVGINLMLSNIASMLIIGVVRFGIEKQWSIEVFGKVSLTLSISNLLMLFVNAVGVVIFPVLKKAKEDSLPILYSNLRNVLMMILLLMLILYYPIIYILARWLPNYSESLSFMVLVFPMAIFEGKMALLVNTYMKALRMEKTIFKVNIFTLLISVISTFIFTVYFKNLELTVLSIVFLLAVRCFFAEYILSKILVIKVMKDILLETILTIIFVLSGWFIGGIESFLLYLCAYCLYLVIKGKDLSYLIESTTLFKNN
nr:hypothetical protein [Globicatella sp. PHS-GS-PNBC-21-1553]